MARSVSDQRERLSASHRISSRTATAKKRASVYEDDLYLRTMRPAKKPRIVGPLERGIPNKRSKPGTRMLTVQLHETLDCYLPAKKATVYVEIDRDLDMKILKRALDVSDAKECRVSV